VVELSEILARHEAFWLCKPADAPLLGMSRWAQISAAQFDWGLPTSEGLLAPEMLSVGHLLPQYEALFADRPLDDDLCWPAMPPTAIPWLEGMLGCPIRYSLPSGSFSAEPAPVDLLLNLGRAPLEGNPWFEKLLEFVDGLASLAHDRFAVGLPLMRGPWDLAAALTGPTELYMGLIDSPDTLRALADICGDLWREVASNLAARIPRWQGGFVGFLGLWAPDFDPLQQDDASVSVSPTLYRKVMRATDARIAAGWHRTIFHLHSAGLQVLDEVLDFLDGHALNVDLDPSGPSAAQILPLLRRVQDRHVPLHLLAFDYGLAREMADSLSPAGLAITYQPLDPYADRAAHPGGLRGADWAGGR